MAKHFSRRLKIGAAQIASEIGDLEANLETHESWIAAARRQNVDLLVFPEVSLCGHHGAEDLLDTAMRRQDRRLTSLAEAASDMMVVVGLIEEGPAAQFYNSAAVLHRNRVVYIHRKLNVPNYGKLDEGKHYATGRFVDTHAIDDDWRLGLLICADVWNPALAHLAFLHGATLLVTPISSAVEAVGAGFDNPRGWGLTMQFYSMIYGAPSVMCNRVGRERDLTFWGGSRIIDPFGKTLAEAGDSEALITAEVDYDDLRQARRQLPTVRDSNVALVQRETERLMDKLGVPDLVRDD